MASEQQFYITNELTGAVSGPFSTLEILRKIDDGTLKKNSLIRRGDSQDWYRASALISHLFEKHERAVVRRKEKERTARKTEEDRLLQIREEQAAAKKNNRERERIAANIAKTQQINNERGTLWSKIVRPPKPSPYWGFHILSEIINVTIYIALALAVVAPLIVSLMSLVGIASNIDAGVDEYVRLILFLLMYLVFSALVTFVVIVNLVFCRNCIDWLIDVECHLNHMSQPNKKLTASGDI